MEKNPLYRFQVKSERWFHIINGRVGRNNQQTRRRRRARRARRAAAAAADDDNPHEAMAMQMLGDGDQQGEAPRAEQESIGSDIFDDSLRYSNVDRPTLKVDVSSPTRQEQRRGSFMDEDRIANFFRRK